MRFCGNGLGWLHMSNEWLTGLAIVSVQRMVRHMRVLRRKSGLVLGSWKQRHVASACYTLF